MPNFKPVLRFTAATFFPLDIQWQKYPVGCPYTFSLSISGTVLLQIVQVCKQHRGEIQLTLLRHVADTDSTIKQFPEPCDVSFVRNPTASVIQCFMEMSNRY